MRESYRLLIIFLLLCLSVGCKEDESADFISLTQNTLRFDSKGERQTVLIKSSEAWKVTCDEDWVFIEEMPESEQFAIAVPENTEGAIRAAIIKITAGNSVKEIDVLQDCTQTYLSLSAEEGKCWDLNTRLAFTIETKSKWDISLSGNWFNVNKQSGKGDEIIVIEFNQNSSSAERIGEITVTTEDGDQRSYRFTQSPSYGELGRTGDSLALIAIYKHFDGAKNWMTDGRPVWDLTEPLEKWRGVYLLDDRVSRLILLTDQKCVGETFPEELKDLTRLNTFYCMETGYHGEIPYQLMRSPYLDDVNFTEPNLKGQLENWLSTMSVVEFFRVCGTSMTGPLFKEFTSSKLKSIDLSYNEFTDYLPPLWCKYKNLTMIKLASNYLVGGIPDCYSQLTRLGTLDVSNNEEMSGNISEDICAMTLYGSLRELLINKTSINPCFE